MTPAGWDDTEWHSPGAITLTYLVFGVAWIAFSDWAVTRLFGLSALTVAAQLAKGLLFVSGSAAFIHWLVARRERHIARREARIRTDRSHIETLRSEVRESEQLLGVIMANVVETILLTDDEGRFTYVCPNVDFIFGYSPGEVHEMGDVRSLLGDAFPPSDFDGREVMENVEREVVDADGRPHTVLVTVKPVEIESGSVLYSVREITERKRQEERFRAYVENSSDVITVLDGERTIEYVSPAAERVLGYEPDELVGRDALEMVHPDDRAMLAAVLGDIDERPAGTTASRRYRTRHADGSWVWTESRLTTHDADSVGRYVINARDISDLREREGRLSVLDRVLRHNIRNKLNIVLGAAEDLGDRLGPERAEQLALIESATEDLLELSEKARRFDSAIRRDTASTEPTDLAEVTRRVVAEKRVEYPGAEFRTHLPDEAWARAHDAIELAIGELVDNAVVHSEDESPTIEVRVEVDGTTTAVSVTDFGPGIPDMDREAVVRGEETPLEHGMNIGLWLVRWTIDNSDGTLSVHENAPAGTRVEARLPSVEPAAAD